MKAGMAKSVPLLVLWVKKYFDPIVISVLLIPCTLMVRGIYIYYQQGTEAIQADKLAALGYWSTHLTMLVSMLAVYVTFVGVIVAVLTLRTNARIALKISIDQKTVDLSMEYAADTELQNMKNKIIEHAKKDIILKYNASDADEQDKFHYVLNKHEFISLAIRKEVIDGELFRLQQRTNFLRFYKYAKPLIQHLRIKSKNIKIYQEFEWLCKKWENEENEVLFPENKQWLSTELNKMGVTSQQQQPNQPLLGHGSAAAQQQQQQQ